MYFSEKQIANCVTNQSGFVQEGVRKEQLPFKYFENLLKRWYLLGKAVYVVVREKDFKGENN